MNQRTIRYCPFCGTSLKDQHPSNEEPTRCLQCGWIYFADPKVAVAVFIQDQGKILLTCRINQPFNGFWSLPAGFMNAFEDPRDAAIRECLEETGLNCRDHITIRGVFWPGTSPGCRFINRLPGRGFAWGSVCRR